MFHCQNEVILGGLLLLAAFSQPIGDPYEWSGSIMELWCEGRGLIVTVKLHDAVCCLLAIILAGYEPCVAHINVYFTCSPSSDIFHKPFAHHPAPHLPPIVVLA